MPHAAPDAEVAPAHRRRGHDLLAWLTLALATLAILWPLGLTNRVLAGVDALTYFTPYWACSHGRAASPGKSRFGTRIFSSVCPSWRTLRLLCSTRCTGPFPGCGPNRRSSGRRSSTRGWPPASPTPLPAVHRAAAGRPRGLAGLIFGLGGFTLARVENINQLNALAWLPALLWLYERPRGAAAGWRSRVRWGAALAVAIALQLLAGHTQTTFVNMVGLGLWAAWPVVMGAWKRKQGNKETRKQGDEDRETRRQEDKETGRQTEDKETTGQEINRLHDCVIICCLYWLSFRRFRWPRRNCCPRWS